MRHSTDVCDLCGLPLHNLTGSTTLDSNGRQYRFCCIGCRQVFTMLMEASDSPDPADFKNTELFKKCLELGVIPKTEDDLAEINRNAQDDIYDSNTKTVTETDGDVGLELYGKVNDMWCPACSWVIEAALRKMKGILSVSCHFSTDRLKCEYDPVQTSPDQIIKKIKSLGYRSVSWETGTETNASRKELIRVLVSAFLTMNIMMFSFALYSGFFSRLTQESIDKLSWPPFIMATVVLVYGGRWIFQKALQGFRSVAFGMETLIGAGALCAYGYSVVHFFLQNLL